MADAALKRTSKTYGTLRLVKDEWIVQAEPHVVLRLKRVLGKVATFAHGEIPLSNTHENCRDLHWFIQRYPFKMTVRDSRRLSQGMRSHRDHVLMLEQIIDSSYVPGDFELAVAPREYQRRAAELYLRQGFLLLGDDLGLGKTASAICSLVDPQKRTLPSTVVAYPHLQKQWLREIQKFTPHLFVHITRSGTPYELPRYECPVCTAAKKSRPRREREDDYLTINPDDAPDECEEGCGRGPDVIVTTYSKLSGWSEVIGSYCKSVIFDEVQELRHSGTDKYAAAEHIAKSVNYRQGLSATPIYNFGGEVFNIMNILSPGTLGTREEFHREWCSGDIERVKDPAAFGTYLRENFLMLRRTRAEVGRELPPVQRIPYQIDSDPNELDKIEDAAGELARVIMARSEAFKGERMSAAEQLSNLVRQATGIAKAPYVADFVKLLVESGEKVVLAGWHRAVYEIWAKKLESLRVGWYTGSESPAAKDAARTAMVNGELDVLMLSLRSGAGLDGLQQIGRVVVFGELDWSPAVMEQVIGRLHRDGQDNSVDAFFLVSDGGSDPVMCETLGIKRGQLDGIRSPGAEPIEVLQTDVGKIRRLAEFYLRKRRTIGLPRS